MPRSADKTDDLVEGVKTVQNLLRTVLGPHSLDKMLVDDVGDVVVSNDGATIVNKLDVQHPAAKVLVDLAKLQDDSVGDGTTTVVILAAEFLVRLHALVKSQIHPTTAISGLKMAIREGVRYVKETISVPTSELGKDIFFNVAKTSMSSKIINTDAELFANICVDALTSVRKVNDDGDYVYPVSAIGVLKQHGKSSSESTLVNGFALNCQRACQGMPQSVSNAKVALLDFDLRIQKLKLGVQIIIDNPRDLDKIRRKEVDLAKERVQRILNAGANVILTTKGIDDLTMKYFVEAGAIGVRRCKKDDLKRIAKATGGEVVLNMASLEGDDEHFDPAWLGNAESVSEERFADDECILIKTKQAQASVILRGANSLMLDEMERALNDALQVTKRAMESSSVVPGGGAVETALSVYLEKFAATVNSREQVAINEVAEALLVIPRQLAINASLDAVDLSARLRVKHHEAVEKKDKASGYFGLDLDSADIRNSLEHGVVEPTMSKVKSLQYAAEAAISILRIDDVFVLPEKEEPQRDECM